MKATTLKLLIFLVPAWFTIVIILAGALTPGYNHLTQAVSELGAPGAPYALFVNLGGFIPMGCAITFFAMTSGRFLVSPAQKTSARIFLGLAGLAIILAGIFPTDPGGRRDTMIGIIHAIAGISLLIVASLTPIIVGALPDQTRGKTTLRIYSLATGGLLVALFLLTPNGLLPGWITLQRKILAGLFPIWYRYYGVHQRLFMIIYFTWLCIFAQVNLNDVTILRRSSN